MAIEGLLVHHHTQGLMVVITAMAVLVGKQSL
ncbi:hypothetical protein SAMN05216167_105292 [Spirosoma endophyticum]|uniref:Uncharacterized protein n=1 Tax=Spirosoma endophyticum TaxID=662367 RepID=A0A1I1T434_9BACT|nr:hypothetical protein SAMN05216167_105292 [Spirosoma endophyticum]